MTVSMVFLGLVVLYIAGSITYVYNYRGNARYTKFSEYLRKSWPIFTPLNCLLYMSTEKRARSSILNINDFPELKSVTDQWQVIKEEAVNLYEKGYFDATVKADSAAYYDVGFRTFFKYGWSKFYLKWYGYTHDSAKMLCPKTVELLKGAPIINGAMFTLLPVGSQLTRHSDPVACSLRYHLGLSTPNSDLCYINIDDQDYSWRDGQALLFDETFLHYAHNDSKQYRLILMCDVERPMNFFGRLFNRIYKAMMASSVVPNTSIDKAGAANRLLYKVTPIMDWGKRLKVSNKPLYKTLEYLLNTILVLLFLLLLVSPFMLF